MGIWHDIELSTLTLAGERLTLRPWRPQDAARVYEGAQDSMMAEFLPIPIPYTHADADAFVTKIATSEPAAGTGVSCAVVETATGALVGGANLRLPHGSRVSAEIGYSIYPWARGKRYATEAASIYAGWAFEHGVGRIEIHTSVRNLPSARAALAAGFRFEATLQREMPTASGIDSGARFARLAGDSGEPVPPALAPLPVGGLSDGVIALRVTDPGDTAALIDEQEDPLARSLAFDDAPIDHARLAAMAAGAALQWLVGPVGRLAMIEVQSGEVAGSMQLRLAGPPNVAEIGYGLRPGYRGHGYTSRALRLLSAWAFERGGFGRLELGAKVHNIASQRAALSGGFTPDGVMAARLRNPDGSFADEARFALVRTV